MLSELQFFYFSLILRGNAHISKNFLQILFLRATLSTKTFMNTGPGFWVSGNSRASQSLSFMWSISSWVLQIGWRSDACDGSDGGVRFRD